jgi:hypothetical protein
MSESDGMDDVLDGGLRQSLMIASRIAETLARRRQESQRQAEQQDAQVAYEAQARLAAERSAAHAAFAPIEKDQWWDKAQHSDIATAHAASMNTPSRSRTRGPRQPLACTKFSSSSAGGYPVA